MLHLHGRGGFEPVPCSLPDLWQGLNQPDNWGVYVTPLSLFITLVALLLDISLCIFFCIFFVFLHNFLKIRCDITFSAPPPPPIFHSIITLRANYLPPYGWVIWYLNAPCTDIFNSMNKDREPYWKYAIYLWVYHCVLTIHIVQLFRFNEVSFLCNWSFRSLSGAQLCCSIT